MIKSQSLIVITSVVFWFAALGAHAQSTPASTSSFTVAASQIADQKAVFATVEAAHIIAARTRLGGSVAELSVQAGDNVTAGETIATVVDPTLAGQLTGLDADIAGLSAQFSQAQTDLARDQQLIHNGAIALSTLDQAQTALNVASSSLKSRIAARASLAQQITDGAVLAPVSGRVLLTMVTQGAVVLAGDSIATIAAQDYVLRLDIPERHARFLKIGDTVRLDAVDAGQGAAQFGVISLIYPQIQNGLVETDVIAPSLGNYFIGERIQAWVFAGLRPGIVIPARFIETRFGLDYADLRNPDGTIIAVPVQHGSPQPTPKMPDGVEILSGLHPGDVLEAPGAAAP